MWESWDRTVVGAVVDNSADRPRGKSSNTRGVFHPLSVRHLEKTGRGASDNVPRGTAQRIEAAYVGTDRME